MSEDETIYDESGLAVGSVGATFDYKPEFPKGLIGKCGEDSTGFFDRKGDYFREGVDPRNYHGRHVPKQMYTILDEASHHKLYWYDKLVRYEMRHKLTIGSFVLMLGRRAP